MSGITKLIKLPQLGQQRLPLGIITGTGVVKGWMAEGAYMAYSLRHPWNNRCRVFPISGQGLGRLDDSYHVLEEQFQEWVDSMPSGTRVAVMGHSQGALHAARLGLEHEEYVAEVVGLCGPMNGTEAARLVLPQMRGWFEAHMPGVLDMEPASEYITWLRHEIEQRWPASVRVRLIAVHGDIFVQPLRSAFDLEFPTGTKVKRYFLGWRRPLALPDNVTFVRVWWADHITVLGSPTVLNLVGHARRDKRHLSSVKTAA